MPKLDPSRPNEFAAPPSLTWEGPIAKVRGYQNYDWNTETGELATTQPRLVERQRLLGEFMESEFLDDREFLDLGANGGYWSLLAAREGAEPFPFEMDHDYEVILDGLRLFPLSEVGLEPYDVVNALSLIHWVYDCTEHFQDAGKIIDAWAGLAKERLHVEWVAPEDPLVVEYGHLGNDPSKYTYERFLESMLRNFKRVWCRGHYTPTRSIWVGEK